MYFPSIIPWWLSAEQVDRIYSLIVADLKMMLSGDQAVPRSSSDTISSVATDGSALAGESLQNRYSMYWMTGDVNWFRRGASASDF